MSVKFLPEELTKKDYLVAALLGGAVSLVLTLFSSAAVHPSVWPDAAAAVGIIPPFEPSPGLWRQLVGLVSSWMGVAACCRTLVVLGHVSGGLLTAFSYLILAETLPTLVRNQMRRVDWGRHLVRFVLALAAIGLTCSDPFWRASQTFSPVTFALLLTFLSLWLFLRFLQTGAFGIAHAVMLIFGVMGADSPAGFVFAFAMVGLAYWKALHTEDSTVNALANPYVRVRALRRMTLFFALGFIPVVALNVSTFLQAGGMEARGWESLDVFIKCLHRYWLQFTCAATWTGWLFGAAFCVAPLLVSLHLLGRATDDDSFLPIRYAVVFLVTGGISFLQLAGWDTFWFWTWVKRPVMVRSEYLLCCGSILSALSFLYALCVLCMEIFFRNYRRITSQRFQDAAEAAEGVAVVRTFAAINPWRRGAALLLLAALPFAVVPLRWQPTERAMLGIVEAYLDEVVDECGDAVKTIFTDGAMDPGIELRARARGRSLKTLSLMPSGDDAYQRALRKRGVADEDERMRLERSAAESLRVKVLGGTNRVDDIAVQLGFELWKRNGLPLPKCSGVLARPDGLDDAAAESGRLAAQALAERILELYRTARPDDCRDRALLDYFRFVQWRLSRFCRARAEVLDKARKADAAVRETRLAEDLDRVNASYQHLREQMGWVGEQKGSRLTPREGLNIGLSRADFVMARTFAEQILRADPDDTQANFAMGMSFFNEEQYARAEAFLRRVVEKSPDNIAALNNLACVQLRLGRLDGAKENSDRAVALAAKLKNPRLRAQVETDVRNTAKAIEERRHAGTAEQRK